MQFSVPQFTDVEDKIIGPLTVKQFGIIFGAGVIVFTAFSLTKSMTALILVGLVAGLPALGLAFAKLNGRPMYNMIGYFLGFLTSQKLLIFHKEAVSDEQAADSKKPAAEKPVLAETIVSPRQRLEEVNRLLEEKSKEEANLIK